MRVVGHFLAIGWMMFSAVFVNAAESAIAEVKSHDVSYDGKSVLLSGEVVIIHNFGVLTCDKAVLAFGSGSQEMKNLTPERIILKKGVRVDLKDGSYLIADEADINCIDLEGYFTAVAPNQVVYLTYMQEGDRKVPVKTKSSAMRVKMKKEEKEGSSQYVVSDMQGMGAVSIEYETEGKVIK